MSAGGQSSQLWSGAFFFRGIRREANLSEVFQQCVPVPTLRAKGLPSIVVRGRTTVKGHHVDQGCATYASALREGLFRLPQQVIWHVRQVPVILGANAATGKTWDVDEVFIEVAVLPKDVPLASSFALMRKRQTKTKWMHGRKHTMDLLR